MKKPLKAAASAVIFISVLTACSQTQNDKTSLSGKWDIYGCLVSAGEHFSYTKQRCLSPLEEHHNRMRAIRMKKGTVHK